MNEKSGRRSVTLHDAWDTTVLSPEWNYLSVTNPAAATFPTIQNRFVGPGLDLVARFTQTISPTLLNVIDFSYANATITLSDRNGPSGAVFQRDPSLGLPLVVTNQQNPQQCDPNVSLDPITGYPQCGMGYLFNNGFAGKMPGVAFLGTNAAYGGRGFVEDPSYMPWGHTNPTYAIRDDVTLFQSGTPFTVINNAGNTGISLTDNAGVSSGLGVAASYPDVVRGAPKPGNNLQSFGPLLLNPSQFVAPRGLTFGDAGRNSLNNPSRLNVDLALAKHFKVTEGSQLEFRAEAFNVFNHTQLRIYDPDNPGSTGNNIVSCYAGPQYSAGFKGSGADCVTGASFLHPVDAHRPRTF